MTFRIQGFAALLLLLAVPPVFAQPAERIYGGPILGAGGVFRSAGQVRPADPGAEGGIHIAVPAARDAFLTMGGMLGGRLTDRLAWELEASFAANVSDNDAFNDRSLLASTGLSWSAHPRARYGPRLEGGFAFADGEAESRRFGYAGVGFRRWYGERIGWHFGIREHFSDGLHILQLRLAFLLR
ncbi:MAG: hypothetical protein Kow00109_20340 [Acidobacteriota bacterium]